MHFLSTVLIALLTGSVAAYTVPANATEGVYVAYLNDEGVEVHLPIAEYRLSASYASDVESKESYAVPFLPSPLDGASSRVKRQITEERLHCGCGFNMDHTDCDHAVEAIKKDFAQYPNGQGVIRPGLAFYSIQGAVVTFACNSRLSDKDFRVTADDFGRIAQTITNACGWYVAGTDQVIGWDATPGRFPILPTAFLYAGYMRFEGQDFCGKAIDSPSTHC